jgi:hypothetical protein
LNAGGSGAEECGESRGWQPLATTEVSETNAKVQHDVERGSHSELGSIVD